MKSKRLFWLSLLALCCLAVAWGIFWKVPYGHSLVSCSSVEGQPEQCVTGPIQYDLSAQIVIGLALLGLSFFCSLIAWVTGLFTTARVKQWGWFAAILFLSPLATFFYSLFGTRQREA
ncbi:MAG TPA: hypothetical protein VH599_11850 [Ktedonobacterales bacterium]|jgi:hypothetical protein